MQVNGVFFPGGAAELVAENQPNEKKIKISPKIVIYILIGDDKIYEKCLIYSSIS